ncbi:hypothetical protein [Metabacillus litoralis]|uniref:hypothetical protein n=1 Tax=Metabacillus litoralis TaxID=152268 RepID=UPI001CFF28E0|nr:hypothetical protein [Metabacillus litoralis]
MRQTLTVLLLLFSIFTTNATYAKAPESYGANGALRDQDLSLVKALTYSLEDEYLAQANYDVYIDKFGAIRPFVQIKVAEKHHISTLLTLFKKYNIEVPKDKAKNYTNSPPSLEHAFSNGIEKEKENISMYNKLELIEVFPDDVLSIFKQLRMDSHTHLQKLERR